MTPEEANKRIIQSRETLFRYKAMSYNGIWPKMDVPLLNEEISVLSEIAAEHTSKGNKLAHLIADWSAYLDQLRAKMN